MKASCSYEQAIFSEPLWSSNCLSFHLYRAERIRGSKLMFALGDSKVQITMPPMRLGLLPSSSQSRSERRAPTFLLEVVCKFCLSAAKLSFALEWFWDPLLSCSKASPKFVRRPQGTRSIFGHSISRAIVASPPPLGCSKTPSNDQPNGRMLVSGLLWLPFTRDKQKQLCPAGNAWTRRMSGRSTGTPLGSRAVFL